MKPNISLAIGLFGIAIASPALKAAEHAHKTVSKQAHADPMFDGYSAISTALYKDDLVAAKKAASGIAMNHKDSPLAVHCQGIVDSKTLEEARTHFKALSDVAIPLAREKGMMHEMHCSMASEGKGANWLQKSGDEVQNPYMGNQMPHCGKMVK